MENLKKSPGSVSQNSDNYSTTKSLPPSHTGKATDKVSRAWGSLQEIRKVAGCEHDDCVVSVAHSTVSFYSVHGAHTIFFTPALFPLCHTEMGRRGQASEIN